MMDAVQETAAAFDPKHGHLGVIQETSGNDKVFTAALLSLLPDSQSLSTNTTLLSSEAIRNVFVTQVSQTDALSDINQRQFSVATLDVLTSSIESSRGTKAFLRMKEVASLQGAKKVKFDSAKSFFNQVTISFPTNRELYKKLVSLINQLETRACRTMLQPFSDIENLLSGHVDLLTALECLKALSGRTKACSTDKKIEFAKPPETILCNNKRSGTSHVPESGRLNKKPRLAMDASLSNVSGAETDQERKRTNEHRRNCFVKNPEKLPVEVGTKKFIQLLVTKLDEFPRIPSHLFEVKLGADVDLNYMVASEFKKLILIKEKTGLNMSVPENTFSYGAVLEALGPAFPLKAIDVESQKEKDMTLGQFTDYMALPSPREKLYNVISLEISLTKMTDFIEPPEVIKQLSWTDTFFTTGHPDRFFAKPECQKYCLMSPMMSYTDFHIDFGGTSVWYHVVKGKKSFLLIEPTEQNLELYEEWSKSKNHSVRFLGEETECYVLELKEGETVIMPSGWIHAVLTDEDSLVFGGNFLHHLAAASQFKINALEERCNIAYRFRFQDFMEISWTAMSDLVDDASKLGVLPEWKIKALIVLFSNLANTEFPNQLTGKMDQNKVLRQGRIFIKKMAGRSLASVRASSELKL